MTEPNGDQINEEEVEQPDAVDATARYRLRSDEELAEITDRFTWPDEELPEAKRPWFDVRPATRARFLTAKGIAGKRAKRSAAQDKQAAAETFFVGEYLYQLISDWGNVPDTDGGEADFTKSNVGRLANQFPTIGNAIVEFADELLIRQGRASEGNSAR